MYEYPGPELGGQTGGQARVAGTKVVEPWRSWRGEGSEAGRVELALVSASGGVREREVERERVETRMKGRRRGMDVEICILLLDQR